MGEIGTSSKLQIKEFDLKSFCQNPAIITIAKRGSGKSVLCRSLISHFGDIPVGIVISYSEHLDPFYSEFFPDAFIYNRDSKRVFAKILRRQTNIKATAKKLALEGKIIDTRILLLMDDCLSDSKSWGKDESLREVLFNGRHYDITYVLTMQAPLEISPALRDNFDYVFLFATDIFNDQTKLHKHYAGIFPTFSSFREVFTQLTYNYGTMVLCRRKTGPKLTDKVFHYKATSDINVQMFGCPQVKKFQERNYNPNWYEIAQAKMFDPSSFGQKKSYQHIPIEKVDIAGHVKFD